MPCLVGYVDVPARAAFAGNFQIIVNTLPWKPGALRLWTMGESPDGYHGSEARLSVGYSDGTSEGELAVGARSIGTISGIGNVQSAGTNFNDFLAASIFNDAFDAYSAELNVSVRSLDCYGMTFDILPSGVAATRAYRFYYLAMSGITLRRKVGFATLPLDGSGVVVTGLGFQPQYLEVLSSKRVVDVKTPFGVGSEMNMGVACGGFQGYEQWRGIDVPFGGYNGAVFANGAGQLSSLGGVLASFDADGFTLTGTPPAGADVHFLYLALEDSGGDFWADQVGWPTPATTYTPGFQADVVSAFMSGGVGSEARGGIGAVDAAGDAGAIFNHIFPTGTGAEMAQVSDGALLELWDGGAFLADQTVTAIGATTFDLDGGFYGGAGGPVSMILTAMRTSQGEACPTIVSASKNTYPHKALEVTTIRA